MLYDKCITFVYFLLFLVLVLTTSHELTDEYQKEEKKKTLICFVSCRCWYKKKEKRKKKRESQTGFPFLVKKQSTVLISPIRSNSSKSSRLLLLAGPKFSLYKPCYACIVDLVAL